MQRLMARSTAGDQSDLARRQLTAADILSALAKRDEIGVRRRETVEALSEDIIDGINKLLHGDPPFSGLKASSERADLAREPRDYLIQGPVFYRVAEICDGHIARP
jgi:hypothetical protein